MPRPPTTEARRQSLRMKRFLIATTTYGLGFVMLALCSAIDLFPVDALAVMGAVFAVANVTFFALLRSGWNLRFADPSLTLAQVCTAASTVALVLALGEKVHFVAVPFYSSLFVFAMLQLRAKQLIRFEAFVLGTYAAAFAFRVEHYAEHLDLRQELLHGALVVLSSLWFAGAAGYISRLRARLQESVATIEQLATRDALTSTWNRRHIDTLLAVELQRRERARGEVCVCLIDLDHFKSINDRFGHMVGDAVLAEVAGRMKATLRAADQLGRFGGEEFLVVLPDTTLEEAAVCAERLRQAVSSLTVPGHPEAALSISIGLARAESGEPGSALLTRVDSALYAAKRAGRDRVQLAAARPPAQAPAVQAPSATSPDKRDTDTAIPA